MYLLLFVFFFNVLIGPCQMFSSPCFSPFTETRITVQGQAVAWRLYCSTLRTGHSAEDRKHFPHTGLLGKEVGAVSWPRTLSARSECQLQAHNAQGHRHRKGVETTGAVRPGRRCYVSVNIYPPTGCPRRANTSCKHSSTINTYGVLHVFFSCLNYIQGPLLLFLIQ